jgi:predicted dehydrogenase
VLAADHNEIVGRDDVDAVIIATPNATHLPIALAAFENGKHVLCEKPLALNLADAKRMAQAAEQAGVRHMTAFTYRFVPAMRYLSHLVQRGDIGQPCHFRSCRLQDWGARNLGWRQVKRLSGTGELGYMLSHRIDFAHLLIGPMRRLVAGMQRLFDVRHGQPSDVDDWVAILAEFENGATGVLESSKLAAGRNESWRSLDYVELNGSDRSFVFRTGLWNTLETGKAGGPGLETISVPEEFWRWPGSPRDTRSGDPLVTFRYDQAWEFVDAIRNQRPCVPSFHDGVRAQAVMDAAVSSAQARGWVDLAC